MQQHSTVLVTGAGGFLGGNLIRLLLAQGHRVRACIRSDDRSVRGLDVQITTGDVTNIDDMRAATNGIETVYHCAALISIEGDRTGMVSNTNIKGPGIVAQACLENGVKRLVHVSSVHSLHPEPNTPIDEERNLVPIDYWSAYARTKAEGERQILQAVEQGLDAVIVNPSGLIGPFDFKPSLLGQLLIQLYTRSIPALVSAGYDFVDVRDVAGAMITAAERGRKGERYLLTGRFRTLTELAQLQYEHLHERAPRMICPIWLARASAPLAVAWGRLTRTRPLYTPESIRIVCDNAIFDTSKARKELDYHPRPFEETLQDTWNWMAFDDPDGPFQSQFGPR